MAKIAKKLTDLVGNTPLMELSGIVESMVWNKILLPNWRLLIRREV